MKRRCSRPGISKLRALAMLFTFSAATLAAATFPSAAIAAASRPPAGSALILPDFKPLERLATESVNLSLGPFMLHTAALILKDEDPEDASVKRLLSGITSLEIHSFQFDHDFAYAEADLDAVRRQVAGPEWAPLVSVQDHKQHEHVDIRVRTDHDRASGLVVITSAPREFTILEITGTISPKDLPKLQSGLHLFGKTSEADVARAVEAAAL